ncbi:MAG: hypothetical protein HND42_06675 [Armatimonadetes bacterium]|nr:hypothetical protein [Armatimonadota bacterium]NOG92911.1 hypothetical protein [Armatimonadota bacterium]
MEGANTRHVRAYSLAETLFAVFLIAICGLIIGSTLPVANASRARADMLNKATEIAQKQMEAVKGLGYANLNATALASAGLLDSTVPDGSGYLRFDNVDSTAYGAPWQILPSGKGRLRIQQVRNDLRSITVRVEWTERNGVRFVQLTNYLGEF